MKMISRRERLSLAVAEAVVAKHLGLEGSMMSQHADVCHGGDSVQLRTYSCHTIPEAEDFTVEVDHVPDEDYECSAVLYRSGHPAPLGKFLWELRLPGVSVVKFDS